METDPRFYHVFPDLSGKQKKCQHQTEKIEIQTAGKTCSGSLYRSCCNFPLFTDYAANLGYKPDFWDQSRGYHRTGSFFNFCLNTKYLIIRKPSDYNAANVSDYVAETLKDAGVDPDDHTVSTNLLTGQNDYTANADGTMPNIICIMNESLSDPGALGNLETNEDYMPFIHSLTENTIKGSLSMPVFGAGTSNSEFEFYPEIPSPSCPPGATYISPM